MAPKRKAKAKRKNKGKNMVVQRRGNVFNELNKCRMVYKVPFEPRTSATGGFQMRVNSHNYTEWLEGATTLPLQELLNHQKNQYDFYRPVGLKIEFTPGSNAIDMGLTQTLPQIVIAYDPDNQGFPHSLGSVMARQHFIFDPTRRFSKYIKFKQVQQPNNIGQDKGWCNMQSEAVNKYGVVWITTTSPVVDAAGTAVANYKLGSITLTVIVDFKIRQLTGIALNDTTEIALTQTLDAVYYDIPAIQG